MDPSPEWWQLSILAGLVSATFGGLYLMRRLASDIAGTADARSERAVRSARRTISGLEPGRKPRHWARGRMQLAMLLTEAGGRNSDASALQEALELLNGIIPVFEHQGLTPEWASAVYYRGRAEWGLAMLRPGTEGLERAVATFRHLLALDTWPRHLLRPVVVSLPAVILVDIGRRKKNSTLMEEGVALAREAVAGARRRIPVEWAIVHRNLSHCLAMLGREKRDRLMIEEAVLMGREAAAATRHSRYPGVWLASQAGLAHALADLGEITRDEGPLREAISLYDEAARLADDESLREGRVSLPQGAGHALLTLGQLTGDSGVLTDSIERLERALSGFREAGLAFAEAETAQLLGLAYISLAAHAGDDARRGQSRHYFGEASLAFRAAGADAHAVEAEKLGADGTAEWQAPAGFTPGYQVK